MPQRRKFHTDEVNQCLHKKCSIHGVPNVSLFDFKFLLVDYEVVKFCVLLRTSSSKTQMLFLKKNIFQEY